MSFCTNCGQPLSGGNFCGNCGSPTSAAKPSESQATSNGNAWATLRDQLDKNWESSVNIEPSVFDGLSVKDWKELQNFLQSRSSSFLGLRTLEDYNYWSAQSNVKPFRALDTIEPFEASLTDFIKSLDPAKQTSKLICSVGTLAQIPYGAPNSGASLYWPEAVEHINEELRVLTDVLRLGFEDNLIGESFDPFIEELDLLSDFGRSFVVPFLGDTPRELELLRNWGPQPGKFSYDMTSALVVGIHAGRLKIPSTLFVNPRMIHLLMDDENNSLPWWMEMSLWYSCAATWKEKSEHDVDALDTHALAESLNSFLLSAKGYPGANLLLEDADLFQELLQAMRSNL